MMESSGDTDEPVAEQSHDQLRELDRANRKLQRKIIRRDRALSVLGAVIVVLLVILLSD